MNVLSRISTMCFILGSLTSCASEPSIVRVPTPIHPPAEWTRDCDQPLLEGAEIKHMAALTIRQIEALDECTDRMRAIRGLRHAP